MKAARFTRSGEPSGRIVAARHRRPSRPVRAEAERVLDAVLEAVRELDLDGVRCVAMTTVWQTVLRVSSDGEAQGGVSTWETSSEPAAVLRAREGLGSRWNDEDSGAWVHVSYPLLVAASDPPREGLRALDIGGWLLERLLGIRTGWSEAIAAGSGLWSNSARDWSGAAEGAGLGSSLVAAGMHREAVRASDPHPSLPDALRQAEWLPPLPDGLCHNLGAAAVDRCLAITVGTSGSIRAVGAYPFDPRPEGFWQYRCDAATAASGGAISSAGNLLEWAEAFSGLPLDWSFAYSESPVLPGVTVRPDVFGRRGPDYPLDATATAFGLRPEHTAADVTAACAVDVWSSFSGLFRRYTDCRPVESVHAGGGVLEGSPVAAQLLADAIGHPVHVSDAPQPALRGAALYAAHYLDSDGSALSIDAVVDTIREGRRPARGSMRRIDPRPIWSERLRERWQLSAG